MAPQFSTAELELSYPIYAADFDPYNNGFLVVGGGGGESKSGVKNKIVSASNARNATMLTVGRRSSIPPRSKKSPTSSTSTCPLAKTLSRR